MLTRELRGVVSQQKRGEDANDQPERRRCLMANQAIEFPREIIPEPREATPPDIRSEKDPSEVKINLSLFDGYYDSEPSKQLWGLSPNEALDVVTNNRSPFLTKDKFKAPYFGGEFKVSTWVSKTKDKKDKARSEDPSVPFVGVQRSKSHFVQSWLLKFDNDDATPDEYETFKVKVQASGLRVDCYSTFKHGVSATLMRVRAVLVLDRPAVDGEFQAVSEYVGQMLIGKSYDTSEHVPYQLAGCWVVAPEREDLAFYDYIDGGLVSVDKVLALCGGPKPAKKEKTSKTTSQVFRDVKKTSVSATNNPSVNLTLNLIENTEDPLPVWNDDSYQTLMAALTDERIVDHADPNSNNAQGKVLWALKRSVALSEKQYPENAKIVETAMDRCKELYVAYATNNLNFKNQGKYTEERVLNDWEANSGGFDKLTPFYIVSIAQKLGFDTDHITGKRRERPPLISESGHAFGREKPRATLSSLIKALFSADICGFQLAFDEFTATEVISEKNQVGWRELTDADVVSIRVNLECNSFKCVPRELIRDALLAVVDRNRVDTAKIWAERLPVWDGTARCESFLVSYLGAFDSQYARAIGLYLFSALAGRLLVPGIKSDMVPILVGSQGAGKSSAIKALCPNEDAFTELKLGDNDDNTKRQLRGILIAELPELAGMGRKDVETLKSFITTTADTWRPAYKERHITYKRRSILIGTTNDDAFLKDPTGNRRFLPIQVGVADSAAIKRDRDQLWAEALHIFKAQGVLFADAEKLGVHESQNFLEEDPIQEKIQRWLLTSRGVAFDSDGQDPIPWGEQSFLRISEVMEYALEIRAADMNLRTKSVSTALKKLGYTNERRRHIPGSPPFKAWVKNVKA